MEVLIISPCHYRFGGWFRAYNIAKRVPSVFLYPKRRYSLARRILMGFFYALRSLFFKRVYIFELQPETLPAGLISLLLCKKVTLDIADEWLYSPTYVNGNCFIKSLIKFIDNLTFLFKDLTLTSDYLLKKYGRGRKLINGVDKGEFVPVDKLEARGRLGIGKKEKIILSFGNTCGEERKHWLKGTYEWLIELDPSIQLLSCKGLCSSKLALYLGACDLVLFPTGDNPCERACFPIRVGTTLNAEKVIATDDSPTEFHKTLKKYDCMLMAETPYKLTIEIIKFFKSSPEEKRELEENVIRAKNVLDWDKVIGGIKCMFQIK